MSSEITICTIISKNYLPYARVLTDTFLKNNPNGKVYVLLVDDIDNKFDPKKEKFSLIKVEEIGIENLQSFCFKYSILEQNTGTKAHFLKYLFEKYKLKKLAYFDPDIIFTNNLENLWKLLDKKSIVLTSHITEPIRDDKHPSEFDILRSGSYNLGFLALSQNETTSKFLNWWIRHLMESGFSDVEKGLFTDQKWIDLVPSIFDDVYIIRHPGYDVAYWNLMQRDIQISDDKTISVNKKPMYFFHFSGFSPENIENVSKHQDRLVLKDIEHLRPIFELYRDLLVENGYFEIKDWKCKFDYFDNGVKIPNLARKVYLEAIQKGIKFEKPFSTVGSKSFINFLNENIDQTQPPISRLLYKIYEDREDLHEVFLDPLGKDRLAFFEWINNSFLREYGYDRIFLPSHILKTSSSDEKSYQSPTDTISQLGFNVIGYLKGEFGVAESARNFVRALESEKIPFVLNNLISGVHRNEDNTFSKFMKENPNPINLIVVNADESDFLHQEVGSNYFKNKYNIGVWAWELSTLPKNLARNEKYYNEIWVLSNFVSESVSKSLSIPVVKVPSPIKFDKSKFVRNKTKFGFNEEDFVFLFIFDFYSVFERKNPLATIKAFQQAFRNNEKVKLVLKCINGEKFSSDFKKLKQFCESKNITLMDKHMDRDEILSLIATCDCYVSLHRSEGFGLTIAEAMCAKKPVIATAYGGNTDFMNINNSFPVKYQLVELGKDYGPYKKENFWAEPDIEHAASLMKYVFENHEESSKIAKKGFEFIQENFSPNVIGQRILNRINSITNLPKLH